MKATTPLTRIDPATGTVTGEGVEVGARPDGIAVGPGAVWVANSQDGTVTRIDPATGQPRGPVTVGSGPAGIAITPYSRVGRQRAGSHRSRLDPATGRVTDTIGVGDGPSAIAATRKAVWVSDEFDATLDRIDPRTDRVARVVRMGSSPQGLVVAGSGVWVAARAFAAASHRGDTLTVVDPTLPATDPTQEVSAHRGLSRTGRRVRRPGRPPSLGRCARAHPRAGSRHEAAAPD